jgi:hypothetical protein
MTPILSLLLAAAAAASPPPSGLAARVVAGSKETDACSYDFSYARLEGLPDAAAQDKINARLKELGTEADACENPPDAGDQDGDPQQEEHHASSGANAVLGGRYLLVESSGWSFTGGAHPNGGSSCAVFDLRTGAETGLAGRLTPAGRTKLRRRLVIEIYAGNKDAFEEFVSSEGPHLSDANICPNGKGLTFHFNPYQVASYADGEKELTVGPRDWRAYFAADETTRAAFEGGSAPVPVK